MIQKIKNLVLILATGSTLLVPALAPVMVGTASADIKSSLCTGTDNAATGGSDSTCGTAGKNGSLDLGNIAQKVVNIFSIIVGIVAVIMIIWGGFRYITSGGDSGSVGNAKNTLIYAIVGLIIVALAQIIVHFVINTASSGAGSLS